MSLRRALLGMTLTLGLTAALMPGAAMAAGGTIRMVDNDGHAAPGHCGSSHHAASHIQSAVDAAHPGDTVLVCPGTYVEQVTILDTHDLTVRSTSQWGAVIKPDTSKDPLYMVGIGDVHDVTFQGFKLVAPTAGDCVKVGAAILVLGTKDLIIRGNQIRAAGSHTLGACGYEVAVALGEEFLTTAAAGVGIADSDPGPTRASVAFNTIRDFQVVGVLASGPGTLATITRNSIRYYHLHVGDSDECLDTLPLITSAGTDVRSQIRRLLKGLPEQGTGIAADVPFACFAVGVLTGVGARAVIKDNRIHSGPDSVPELSPVEAATTPLLLAGIVNLESDTAKPTRIAENKVYRTVAGIGVLGAFGTVITDNRLTSSVVGMYLDSVEELHVTDNLATDNFVGILLADAIANFFDSNSNHFVGNDARGNSEASCVDDTSDGDTPFAGDLGTDNRWRHNQGEIGSSDPQGICGDIDVN